MRTVLALLLIAACSKDGGGGAGSAGSASPATAGSAAAKKGGGFSASLSAELAKEGSGSGASPGANGSATAGSNGGSAVAVAPVGSGGPAPAAGSSSGSSAGSSAVAMSRPADTKPADTKPADTKPADTKPVAGTIERPSATRAPVKPAPEIAAIKMDLEPNWDRDVGEAATISFVLKVPGSNDTRLFSFHYGYDPAGAPADRDAYKKWLADQKILSATLDRQRGAAWYLEGTDGTGAPAFRYRVTYGGKQLVCWGSLYKDAASTSLGDLRDKVVMAAKKICETMTL